QPAGDRIAARQAEFLVIPMVPDEVALEPARVLQLVAVDGDRRAARLGGEAQHDRGGERPGLRGMIAHLADNDAGLLVNLARHRILEAFAGLDEAGQGRMLTLGPDALT